MSRGLVPVFCEANRLVGWVGVENREKVLVAMIRRRRDKTS